MDTKQKERYYKLISQGLCSVCGHSPLKTKTRCEICNNKEKQAKANGKRIREPIAKKLDANVKVMCIAGLLRVGFQKVFKSSVWVVNGLRDMKIITNLS